MIIEVVGKEIEKIKGDFESYLNGLNMVGEISYSQYSKLYDEGTKQIQRAYELGRAELEAEVKEWKDKADLWCKTANLKDHNIMINKELEKENAELKDYRLTTLAKQQTDMSKYALNLEHKLSWYDDQLTKAKELLKRFIELENCTLDYDDIKEAEQFLRDN